jgi:probable rRNA maturation factor
MVVIQNIINDSNVDEENLSQVCQDFLNENALEDSELLIRLVSPVEIQVELITQNPLKHFHLKNPDKPD